MAMFLIGLLMAFGLVAWAAGAARASAMRRSAAPTPGSSSVARGGPFAVDAGAGWGGGDAGCASDGGAGAGACGGDGGGGGGGE